jgi:hypothetical protein
MHLSLFVVFTQIHFLNCHLFKCLCTNFYSFQKYIQTYVDNLIHIFSFNGLLLGSPIEFLSIFGYLIENWYKFEHFKFANG